MRIVIDTSALYDDLALDRPEARLLLAAARNGEIELVVPEIVILEASNIVRERLEEASVSILTARRKLDSLGVAVAVDLPDAGEAVVAYEQKLRRRLREAGARSPDPPSIAHVDVAKRAIAEQKPFDRKGRGYRDTLIWLQALEEAAGDQVVLVTRNSKDFAGDGSETLAPELAGELEVAGLAPDRVEIVDSLVSVVRRYVEPSAQALTRLHARLEDEDFLDQLALAIQESLQYKEIPAPPDEDLRMLDVHEVQIELVEDVRDLEIDDAYETEEGTVAFNVGGTLVAVAEFFPFKYEMVPADVSRVTVHDWDWNESVVQASKSLEVTIEGFAEYDFEQEEVRSADVWLTY